MALIPQAFNLFLIPEGITRKKEISIIQRGIVQTGRHGKCLDFAIIVGT